MVGSDETATVTRSGTAERARRAGAFEVPRFFDCAILVAGALVYGLLSVRSGKDFNWDVFNYHFYNGWAAWTGHSWTNIAPAQVQSFLNPALDIPQYLAIAHLPPKLVGFIIGAIQGTSIFLVFAIIRGLGRLGRSLLDTSIALAAAAVALSGPAAISELGSTMGDLTLAVPVMLGVFLIVQAFGSEGRQRASWKIVGAGICLGATAGVKYTTGICAVAAAGALLIRPPPSLSRLGSIQRLFVAGVLSFLVAAGPWMIELDAHYRSPMFPFFNAWFRSPYAAPVTWFNSTFRFETLPGTLLFPFSLIHDGVHHLQISFRSLGLPLAFCCLLLSVLLGLASYLRIGPPGRRASRPASLRLLPAECWLLLYFGLTYVVWAKSFGDYRYFLYSEVLVPAIIVVTVCQVTRPPLVRLATILVAGLVLLTSVSVGSWGRGTWKTGTYFDIALPSRAVAEGTMVVMAGQQRLAFVIPFFGNGVRFVRVQSNFDVIGLELPKYARMLSRTIAAHRGPLALLITAEDLPAADAVVRPYGLAVAAESCVPIRSAYAMQIELCRLARTDARRPIAPGAGGA